MKFIKNLVIFIIIAFIISPIVLSQNLGDLDELWNYNFARNIFDGKLPYKDFNMVQTPLLPIIASIFLKLIANELIVMRILAIILCTSILFMTYKILEKLGINKFVSMFFTIGIGYLFKEHFRVDYNLAILLITQLIILFELRNKEDKVLELNPKYDIIIGFLAATTILFKQTTGFILTVIAIGYPLLMVENKEQLKTFLKLMIYRGIGAIIPILILIVYILINNIWMDFVSYVIQGVKTFSNSILYTNLFENDKWYIKVLAVILPITLVIQFILGVVRNNNSKINKRFLILFSYSIASVVTVFPISDEIHFLIGTTPSIITLLYMLYIIGLKIKKDKIKMFFKYFIQVFTVGIIIYMLWKSVIMLKEYIETASIYQELKHFKYIPISENLCNQIKFIDEYIKNDEKEVYILDATACAFMIPIDRYNKNYDMFLKGNLGKDGENGIIEDLKNIKGTKILIIKDKNLRNWQNPEEVSEYIQENFTKVEEVLYYNVYER